MEDFLTGKKHIHFIGIGGSGMYPLAQILHSQGYYLTGSDSNGNGDPGRGSENGYPGTSGAFPGEYRGRRHPDRAHRRDNG